MLTDQYEYRIKVCNYCGQIIPDNMGGKTVAIPKWLVESQKRITEINKKIEEEKAMHKTQVNDGVAMICKNMEKKQRGFQRINVHPGDFKPSIPSRATAGSAGYDFVSTAYTELQPGESVTIPTKIRAYMPEDEVLLIYIRSSLGIKRGLTLCNGTSVIDSDYYGNEDNGGEIMIAIRNNSDKVQSIHMGERIAQGVFVKYQTCGDEPKRKRSGGIGSTGR